MKLKQRKKELPLMNGIIRAWIKSQGRSLRKLSKQMGQGENYLQQNLKSNDRRPSLLIELSGWLGANMFEPYLLILDANPIIKPTEKEQKLLTEIESLKKELEEVKKERDRYWEVIGKR